ncbi:hypothetical protein JL720_14805 [Aureococcus anophagefferens]|nr:hypothetical protein JL720_14805 [Aureococcus anophagefferens]
MTSTSRMSLLVVLLAATACHAFVAPTRTSASRVARRAEGDDMDSLLQGLQSRVQEMMTRQATMPIVVLDSMLPGQRINLQSADPAFREMIEWVGVKASEDSGEEQYDDDSKGVFGMVGADRQNGGALPFGVEARVLDVADKEGVLHVEIAGGRRFFVDADRSAEDDAKRDGAVYPRTVTIAAPLDAADEADAAAAAAEIPALLGPGRIWSRRRRRCRTTSRGSGATSARSRRRRSRRTSPSGSAATSTRSRPWACRWRSGAAVATTPADRVQVAVAGLTSSIAHLDGSKPMW